MFVHGLYMRECDEVAFRAARHGARDMAQRRSPCATGQDEFLEWWQVGIVFFQQGIEPRDVGISDHGIAWDTQLAAQVEQIMLHSQQFRAQ